jgi:hypothetical protein
VILFARLGYTHHFLCNDISTPAVQALLDEHFGRKVEILRWPYHRADGKTLWLVNAKAEGETEFGL